MFGSDAISLFKLKYMLDVLNYLIIKRILKKYQINKNDYYINIHDFTYYDEPHCLVVTFITNIDKDVLNDFTTDIKKILNTTGIKEFSIGKSYNGQKTIIDEIYFVCKI
jgi:hypothetical protein